MKVLLRAFAKVNYALEVRGLREDGYHEISTVMQSISLADELEIEHADEGFELVVEPEGFGVGPTEKNTVYRARELLGKLVGGELPVKTRLRKGIPAGAGLGGGSADAAAALTGLNELFGLGLSIAELRDLSLRIGADVRFCLSGGTALGEGIGSAEDIDTGMVYGLNYPRGPLRWADAVGVDHVLTVLDALFEERREERYRAAPFLRELVLSGRIGRQTGEGFFGY